VKLCLVALKCDLRDDDRTKERLAKYGEKCITYDEGLAMAKQIRAVRYLGSSLPVHGRLYLQVLVVYVLMSIRMFCKT